MRWPEEEQDKHEPRNVGIDDATHRGVEGDTSDDITGDLLPNLSPSKRAAAAAATAAAAHLHEPEPEPEPEMCA